MTLSKFFRDLYTGPDGETWAFGRIHAVPVLLVGLAAPILAIIRSSPDHPIDLAQVGLELTGIATAVGGIAAITKNLDSERGNALSSPKEST
jgi:hypothetical protein